jgi:hypothetical protein
MLLYQDGVATLKSRMRILLVIVVCVGVGSTVNGLEPKQRVIADSNQDENARSAQLLWEQGFQAIRGGDLNRGLQLLEQSKAAFESLKQSAPTSYELPWAKVVLTLAGMYFDLPAQRSRAKSLLEQADPTVRRLASSNDEARAALQSAQLLWVRVYAADSDGPAMCRTAKEAVATQGLSSDVRQWLDGIVTRCPK